MKFNNIIHVLLETLLLTSCAIPISTATKYPIDVFAVGQTVDLPYHPIEWVEITHADSLTPKQTSKDKRMLDRGMNANQKEVITAQLVLKARELGADALVEVSYEYFADQKTEGYLMRGLAVRYGGE